MSTLFGYRAEVVLYHEDGRRLYIDAIDVAAPYGVAVRMDVVAEAVGDAFSAPITSPRWRVEYDGEEL